MAGPATTRVVAFAVAAWVGAAFPGLWPLALVGLGLLVAAAWRLRVAGDARAGAIVVAVVAVGVLASGLAGGRVALAEGGALAAAAAEGSVVALTGSVVTEPQELPGGGWWALLRVVTVDGARAGGRVLLRAGERGPATERPPFGAVAAVRGPVRALEHDGFERYLRNQGAGFAVLPLEGPAVERGPPWWLRLTNAARERIRAAAAAHLPPDAAGLLTGLVTGDTQGLSADREEQLRAAGLSHVVAVSGSNVALVVGAAGALARAVGLGARGRRRVALTVLVWFVLLARVEPSVLRAAAVAGLALAAGTLGRPRHPLHGLAAAVLLLVLVDPLLARQVGFVLSVAATAGVLVLGPVVAARLRGPQPLRTAVGATLGAQIAVVPVLLALDGVPAGALPANLVALPAVGVAGLIGAAAAAIAQVAVPLGGLVAVVALPLLRAVLWCGATFARWPAVTLADALTPVGLLVGAAVVVLVGCRRSGPRVLRHAAAALAALLVVVAGAGAWPRTSGPVVGLAVTALDVGQGDAVLIRAGPTALLVDAGPPQGDVVARLRRAGVRRLDALLLSHPHRDHVGGAPALLAAVPVGTLLVGPHPLDPAVVHAQEAWAAEALAARLGVPLTRVAAGDSLVLGALRLEVLSPPRGDELPADLNERSVVVRVVGSGCTVLLTGDAEVAAQSRLLAGRADLRAHLLKVPHHGGDTNAAAFLDTVGARVAVISAGRENDFGHPDPDVLADIAPARVRRTDLEGTVDVLLSPCT